MDNSSLSRSVEQLSSPLESEPRRNKQPPPVVAPAAHSRSSATRGGTWGSISRWAGRPVTGTLNVLFRNARKLCPRNRAGLIWSKATVIFLFLLFASFVSSLRRPDERRILNEYWIECSINYSIIDQPFSSQLSPKRAMHFAWKCELNCFAVANNWCATPTRAVRNNSCGGIKSIESFPRSGSRDGNKAVLARCDSFAQWRMHSQVHEDSSLIFQSYALACNSWHTVDVFTLWWLFTSALLRRSV